MYNEDQVEYALKQRRRQVAWDNEKELLTEIQYTTTKAVIIKAGSKIYSQEFLDALETYGVTVFKSENMSDGKWQFVLPKLGSVVDAD